MPKPIQLSVRIEASLKEKFKETCERLRFSQSDAVTALIEVFLDDLSESGQTKLVRAKEWITQIEKFKGMGNV